MIKQYFRIIINPVLIISLFIISLIIFLLFFYYKYKRFSCIQEENNYLDSDILYYKYLKDLEKFSYNYKNID